MKKPDWIKGHKIIVAIDGPSGAGKSTVSRQLADALGGILLDTGAMYRSVAFFGVLKGKRQANDLGKIARSLDYRVDSETQTLLVNEEDLGAKLRTPAVSEMASLVSRFKSVRKALTSRQRSLAKKWSRRTPVVVEGRDIGTIVFPNVEFKFYVTADPIVRAKRRYDQLKRSGVKSVTLKSILKSQEQRDLQDSTRKLAPLKCAEDALVVDTSTMGIKQVVRFLMDHIHGRVSLPQSQQ